MHCGWRRLGHQHLLLLLQVLRQMVVLLWQVAEGLLLLQEQLCWGWERWLLVILPVPQDSDESVVENCLGAGNGFPSLLVGKVLDEGCFWVSLKSNLNVNNSSKFAEVFIELGNVVQFLGDFLDF